MTKHKHKNHKDMATTIETFRQAVNAKLDTLALTYGETTELTEGEVNTVSYAIDDSNETVNPNLPTRPTL